MPEDVVQKLMDLFGESASWPGDHAAKRRHLIDGLCRLIGADCWACRRFSPIGCGECPAITELMYGKFYGDRPSVHVNSTGHPDLDRDDRMLMDEVSASRSHMTRLRSQPDRKIDTPRDSVRCSWRNPALGHQVVSCQLLPDQSFSLVTLFRHESAGPFSQGDARIVNIMLSEIRWFYANFKVRRSPAHQPMLAPRLQETMNALLDGLGRKQVAARLGISENTVSGYVKEIYRYHKVQSQVELMKVFRHGDSLNTMRKNPAIMQQAP